MPGGIQHRGTSWIPAFAGMTAQGAFLRDACPPQGWNASEKQNASHSQNRSGRSFDNLRTGQVEAGHG
jgi:hypothetical protein